MSQLFSETSLFCWEENIRGPILQSKGLVITFLIWAYAITNKMAMYSHSYFLKTALKRRAYEFELESLSYDFSCL